MCMNCGCGRPNEDHDEPANITAAALVRAAAVNGQSLRESAQHIVETVELLDASRPDRRGLGEPAARSGGTGHGRGTPASES